MNKKSVNIRNKVIFLGTGGGASMVGLQTFSTAGFWVNIEGKNLYFDPGPGAIWHIRKSGLDPQKLDAVLVSHLHIDHSNDINPLIDAKKFLNEGDLSFKIFVPDSLLKEGRITPFHRKKFGKDIVKLKPETNYRFKGISITTSKKLLEKPYYSGKVEEYGFLLKSKGIKLAYLPETYYKEELLKNFRNKADVLIANFLRPDKENNFKMVINSIKNINSKIVVLRHWNIQAHEYGINKIAKRVEKETGIKTLAAKDSDVFNLKKLKMI